MSVIDYSGSGTNYEIDNQGSVLPGYAPYLCLAFKLIATMVNLLLAGWVVFTIKTTRSLHNSHNIFLANVLVSGMIFTLSGTSIMMISYQLGAESPITCYTSKLRILPYDAHKMSFVMMAADKVIAVTFPFKHKHLV